MSTFLVKLGETCPFNSWEQLWEQTLAAGHLLSLGGSKTLADFSMLPCTRFAEDPTDARAFLAHRNLTVSAPCHNAASATDLWDEWELGQVSDTS